MGTPIGNVSLDQDVCRALSGELCRSDGEHIGSTTETVGDQPDVDIAPRRDRKKVKVVETDGDARNSGRSICLLYTSDAADE